VISCSTSEWAAVGSGPHRPVRFLPEYDNAARMSPDRAPVGGSWRPFPYGLALWRVRAAEHLYPDRKPGVRAFLASPLREHARQPTERIERDRCDEPLQGSYQDLLVDELAHEPEDDAEQSQDRPDQVITSSRAATHLPRAPTSGGGADRAEAKRIHRENRGALRVGERLLMAARD